MKSEWMENYTRLLENPFAPRWSTQCGDRITETDLRFINQFESELNAAPGDAQTPNNFIMKFLHTMRSRSAFFQQRMLNLNIETEFEKILPMERADLQNNLAAIIPLDERLDGLVINPTSGTTGQPIQAPNHPRAVGCYIPLILYALQKHGVQPSLTSQSVASVQLCAQKKTMTYATVHSQANGSGFAKINLSPMDWRNESHSQEFLRSTSPEFLSGDPFSFLEAQRMGISVQTKALISTALTLDSVDHAQLSAWIKNAPVVNIYSMNESGPIAYSCPEDPLSFHILPHDLHVEAVRPDASICREGEIGELLLTGGRNPFLPLLRYRTGDSGSIVYGPCKCGENRARIQNLTSRRTVIFKDHTDSSVNPIDVARILRSYPILQHRVKQYRDRRLEISLRVDTNIWTPMVLGSLTTEIQTLFGIDIPISMRTDLDPSEKKIIPYEVET